MSAWTEIPSADTRQLRVCAERVLATRPMQRTVDFRHQSVKPSFPSGGIPAFARKSTLFSPFLRIHSSLIIRKLPSAHSELWRGANYDTRYSI
jgi:hypothetical protein